MAAIKFLFFFTLLVVLQNHVESTPFPSLALEESLTFSPVPRQSQGSGGIFNGFGQFFNGFLTGFQTAVQGGVQGTNTLLNGFGDAANTTFNGLLSGYNSTAQGLIQGASTVVGGSTNRTRSEISE